MEGGEGGGEDLLAIEGEGGGEYWLVMVGEGGQINLILRCSSIKF